MKHYGDITKISGAEVPVVDIITGGSPCQDLSVAGKRAGLAGKRSGLFMEQMRIVKEMRERDVRDNGRTGFAVRPRYMVWENVPGAFSSGNPKGADFAAVIEEIIKVAEPDASVSVCVPNGGWTKSGCYYAEDGSWSVAWRVHDAQFWGVPQRRKRIALVADFGGLSAPEILFERKGLSRDPEPGAAARKRTAGATGSGVEGASVKVFGISAYESNAMKSPNPRSGIYEAETARTLDLNGGSPACNQGGVAIVQGSYVPDVAHALSARHDGSPQPDKGNGANIVCVHRNASGEVRENNVAYTIGTNANASGRNAPLVYDAHGNGEGSICPTITGDHQNRVTDYTVLCVGNGQLNQMSMAEQANTLDTMHDQQAVMCFQNTGQGWWNESDVGATIRTPCGGDSVKANLVAAVDCRNATENADVNGTLQAKEQGQNLNSNNVLRCGSVVRRLTPLECERLQGYPSKKMVDVSQMTKDEYIAWNLAEGNIIADQERGKVYGTRGPGGCPYKEPKELKGSDVNGYKVVSIRNGATKLQCRVHRIIWISAHGIIPDGYVIDHINNDKTDNRLENLQLLTPEQNSQKAQADGLYKSGLDNKATKLDPDLKDEIAFLYEYSDLTMRNLAELYGVSKSRIAQIVHEVGWTDIGEWTDSKGKRHKDADSPRYKALGNSIALPFWAWLARRICAQYERPATMASLFDGIGGFPLVFQRSGAVPVWASEIEEFPIAVTKKHFPEE